MVAVLRLSTPRVASLKRSDRWLRVYVTRQDGSRQNRKLPRMRAAGVPPPPPPPPPSLSLPPSPSASATTRPSGPTKTGRGRSRRASGRTRSTPRSLVSLKASGRRSRSSAPAVRGHADSSERWRYPSSPSFPSASRRSSRGSSTSLPGFLRDDPHAVVLGPAAAAEGEREEGLLRLARLGRLLRDLEVTVRRRARAWPRRCRHASGTGAAGTRRWGSGSTRSGAGSTPRSSQLRSTRAHRPGSAPVSSDSSRAALGRPSRGSPSSLRGTCRRSRPVPGSSRTPNVDSIQDARGWRRNASYSSGGASSEATASRMSPRTGGGGSERSISGVARSRVSPTICSGANGTPKSACDTFATSTFCSSLLPPLAIVADVPTHRRSLPKAWRQRRISIATSAPWRPR